MLALLVVMIWGMNPAIAKLAMLEIPPFAFLALRYLLTFLVFIPFAKVRPADWKIIIPFALCDNVINTGINFLAFQQLSPAISSILLQTGAPVAVLMACLFAGERISLRQTIGIVVALLGVMVVLKMPQMSLIGVGGILVTRILWGVCEILFKNTKQMQAPAFLAYSSLIALPFVGVLSLLAEGDFYDQMPSLDWGVLSLSLIFQVFGMSAALVIWQKLIARHGVSLVSPFALLQVVVGILSSMWLFGNDISFSTLAGAGLIVLGVSFSTYKSKNSFAKEMI